MELGDNNIDLVDMFLISKIDFLGFASQWYIHVPWHFLKYLKKKKKGWKDANMEKRQ